MSSELDGLEEFIMADARRIYSDTVIEHAMTPRNAGIMHDADGTAKITGPCGDTMEVWLKVNGKMITDINFMFNCRFNPQCTVVTNITRSTNSTRIRNKCIFTYKYIMSNIIICPYFYSI